MDPIKLRLIRGRCLPDILDLIQISHIREIETGLHKQPFGHDRPDVDFHQFILLVPIIQFEFSRRLAVITQTMQEHQRLAPNFGQHWDGPDDRALAKTGWILPELLSAHLTQDIPLASVLVPKGVTVISPRGELYTEDNIRERLSIRNFMQDIREAGGITPGPRQFGQKEKQRFSDTFDKELMKCLKRINLHRGER